MTEAFLQYVWRHRLLEGPLETVGGLPVVVERPGELNRDAGPDFFDARVMIGDIRWAGNVEVHVKASDWKAHRHSEDKAYNNVILHVVYRYDTDVVLENGKVVPTVEIAGAIPERVMANYEKLMQPETGDEIGCAPWLPTIPSFLMQISQERLVVERLERKSGDVQRILEETRGGWEEACYWLVAHYFGGKANAFPFELLAKRTPLQVLAKMRDDAFRVEALLYGQAGLLEGEFADEYPKAMQREYDYQRQSYRLTPIEGHLWKFFRLRPVSFATLRISQFAQLIVRSHSLFSVLLETREVATLRELFEVQASDYWQTHYTFDRETKQHGTTLGKSVIDTILINAWVPLLFQYGVQHGEEERKEQALALLQQLPPENNRIVRLWRQLGVTADNAAETQALIQRYNEYCAAKRCLDCPLAFKLIKGK